MPGVSINGQPIPFPAPLVESCFKHHWVDCTHLAETSLSKARKVLQRENLSQGILWPVPFWGAPVSASRASLPIVIPGNSRLDSNMAVLSPKISLRGTTPSLTLLRSGIASSAPVRPDSIDMRLILSGLPSGSASQRSSCARWSTCLFLFASFSTSYAGIPPLTSEGV